MRSMIRLANRVLARFRAAFVSKRPSIKPSRATTHATSDAMRLKCPSASNLYGTGLGANLLTSLGLERPIGRKTLSARWRSGLNAMREFGAELRQFGPYH